MRLQRGWAWVRFVVSDSERIEADATQCNCLYGFEMSGHFGLRNEGNGRGGMERAEPGGSDWIGGENARGKSGDGPDRPQG